MGFINEERVSQIIREELDKLILMEEMGVSDEVMDIADKLADILLQKYPQTQAIYNGQWGAPWVDENGQTHDCHVYGYIFQIDVSQEMMEICPAIKTVDLDVTAFENYEGYAYNVKRYDFNGESILKNGLIKISMSTFDSTLHKKHMFPMLVHEVGHIYQFYQSQLHQNEIKPNDLYQKAIDNLENDDMVIRTIAQFLYFFSDKEIDAMVQETYGDLATMKATGNECELKATRPSSYMEAMIQAFGDLKQINPNEFGKKLKIFGIGREKFIRYIRGQMDKFQWKMRRAYYLFKDRQNPRQTGFGRKWYPK